MIVNMVHLAMPESHQRATTTYQNNAQDQRARATNKNKEHGRRTRVNKIKKEQHEITKTKNALRNFPASVPASSTCLPCAGINIGSASRTASELWQYGSNPLR